MTERAWCTFRCLVQAVYREVRHLGPAGDVEARCQADGVYTAAAVRCKENRVLLQGLTLWERGRTATGPDEVLAPYRAATGLAPEDLPAVFRLPVWTLSYGGERWAVIAEALLELRAALVAGNESAADAACARIGTLRHNSGPLVPTTEAERADWHRLKWQQAKWPALCDEERR